jgi:hypothetical protein
VTVQSPLVASIALAIPANLSHAIADAAWLLSAFGGNAELAEAADAKRRHWDRPARGRTNDEALAGDLPAA